ncbi:hypothetical protein DKM44_02685 [Deinococcus irradiatisoli]|uniref:ABM domain-containing protein n=1 Tax=Deinococcus irradiatisoli TaxID=2202254 RepID=A0A2Z3JE09_9DEIO|nr:hypothetical protein [Deinococcus irradiatisoli]AWN22276.1 hypothetical protein DKM44_02685 [Deinococcus irradiatisoli]
MPRAARIHYLEGKGESRREALMAFLQQLKGRPGLLDACLLSSPAQPGLWLVESRWESEVPPLTVPEGCQHWSFEVQAEV